ncbi:hypothetical protein [Kosakonia sp. S42]|uniref:hypothetical protein n=1 Tax=Kosakonia sp. S42 TaxID=2767458 RepID=UPI0028155BFA|nr:hypothetical protein [Kosakonia sp. S42]
MFSRFISLSASFFLLLIAFTISLMGHTESLTDKAEYQQISGLIREPLTLSVTLNNGQPAILDAFVTRPVSKKPLPVVLITNGTTGTAEFDRWILNPNR